MITTERKLRIGVIFGGRSSEHDISQNSALSIMRYLDREKYEVIPIKIMRTGQWVAGTSVEQLLSDHFCADSTDEYVSLSSRSDPAHIRYLSRESTDKQVAIDKDFDVLFPVLHGTYGEDGTIQGLFEMANVPYVGCGVLGSALGMDKDMMKMIFQAQGLPTTKYRTYRRHAWESSRKLILDSIEQSLGYPCFVKPTNGGSSIGISKVYNRYQLEQAMDLAARYDSKIIVEQSIDCRELTCSVLGNNDPIVCAIGETIVNNDFYDYNAKYLDNTSQTLIPANISKSLTEHIRQQAIEVFFALNLCGLARVDFFLEKKTHQVFVNEVNTLPSFTHQCMFPRLCAASGLSYPDLLDYLITLALERHTDRQRNYTDIRVHTLAGISS